MLYQTQYCTHYTSQQCRLLISINCRIKVCNIYAAQLEFCSKSKDSKQLAEITCVILSSCEGIPSTVSGGSSNSIDVSLVDAGACWESCCSKSVIIVVLCVRISTNHTINNHFILYIAIVTGSRHLHLTGTYYVESSSSSSSNVVA